jgi:hypothetical protein
MHGERRLSTFAALVAVAAGCTQTTQILVVVDTNLDLRSVAAVDVTTRAADGRVVDRHRFPAEYGVTSWPMSFAVLPSTASDGPFDVEAAAVVRNAMGAETIIVSRRSRAMFNHGRRVVVFVPLLRECVNVACPDGQTCGEGARCVDPSVPAAPEVPPCETEAERCDGRDNDCDGRTDEDATAESCNGEDDDCDQGVDEDFGCGACATACPAGTTCTSDRCECPPPAPFGFPLGEPEECGSLDPHTASTSCVDFSDPFRAALGLAPACPPGGGSFGCMCLRYCESGWGQCEGDTACDTDLAATPTSCGACGIACAATAACESGQCHCGGATDCRAAIGTCEGGIECVLGARCSSDTECGGRRCLAAPDGVRRCLAPCMTEDCPAGLVCALEGPATGACISTCPGRAGAPEVCGDSVDDDCDGVADARPLNDSCVGAPTIVPGSRAVARVTCATADYVTACREAQPDVAWSLAVDGTPALWSVDLVPARPTQWTLALHRTPACDTSDLRFCAVATDAGRTSARLSLETLPRGDYRVVAGASEGWNEGGAELRVTRTDIDPASYDACPGIFIRYDGVYAGTTVGRTDDYTPPAGCPVATAASSPDVVFRFNAARSGTVTLDTAGSALDTIVYVGSTCGMSDLGCSDDTGGAFSSRLSFPVTAGGAYAIVVDGYRGAGAFVLSVTGIE